MVVPAVTVVRVALMAAMAGVAEMVGRPGLAVRAVVVRPAGWVRPAVMPVLVALVVMRGSAVMVVRAALRAAMVAAAVMRGRLRPVVPVVPVGLADALCLRVRPVWLVVPGVLVGRAVMVRPGVPVVRPRRAVSVVSVWPLLVRSGVSVVAVVAGLTPQV